MHFKIFSATVCLSLFAVALATPFDSLFGRDTCKHDNCYRAVQAYQGRQMGFCSSYLQTSTATTPSAVATCGPSRLSTACGCLVSTTPASTATTNPTTTSITPTPTTTSTTTSPTSSLTNCPTFYSVTVTQTASTVTVPTTITLSPSTVTLPAGTITLPPVTMPASTVTVPIMLNQPTVTITATATGSCPATTTTTSTTAAGSTNSPIVHNPSPSNTPVLGVPITCPTADNTTITTTEIGSSRLTVFQMYTVHCGTNYISDSEIFNMPSDNIQQCAQQCSDHSGTASIVCTGATYISGTCFGSSDTGYSASDSRAVGIVLDQ